MEQLIEKLNKDGFVVTSIEGNSMRPLLKENKDRVIIEKTDDLHKLDIVLYKKDNKYLLHRLLKIDNNTLYLRGDNTLALEKIDINDVKGVLKSYYHLNSYIQINKYTNYKYYYLSLLTYPFRLIKAKLKRYANK